MPLLARRRKPPLRRQACARPLGSLRACGARGMLGMGAMYGVLPIQAHLDGGRVLIRPRSSFVYGWGDAFMRLLGIHNVTMCLGNAFYLYAFPQCPIVLMVAGFGCRAFPAPAFHRMGRARRAHPFVTRAPRRSANWPCVSLSILSPPLFTWMVADTSCPLTDNAIMFKESIVDVIFLHVVINSVLTVFPKKMREVAFIKEKVLPWRFLKTKPSSMAKITLFAQVIQELPKELIK